MDYWISVWRNVHDNAVKTLGSGDWDWLLAQLEKAEVTDDKYSQLLFNLTHFDAKAKSTGLYVEDKTTGSWQDQRRGDNIVEVTGLLIDYDNESLLQEPWTMDAVGERFKEYTYLMYSSHSYWKRAPPIERFRLVLPFAKPLPIRSLDEDWHPLVPAMKKFIGYEEAKNLPEELQYPEPETGKLVTRDKPAIDKQSFTPVQGYFLPSCPIGKTVVYRKNTGKFLDPSIFERSERSATAGKTFEMPADARRGGEGRVIRETFDVLSWLKTNGLYLSSLGAGKHQIICPWHHEHTKAAKTGTALLPGKHSSLPTIYCHHNHEVSTWRLIKEQGDEAIRAYCYTRPVDDYQEEIAQILRRHRERAAEIEGERPKISLDDLLPGFVDEPVHPFTQDERTALIRKKCLDNKLADKRDVMLLYAFEGFGKSYYAFLLATEKKSKVLFASISNEQASEQADNFRSLGLRVQFIPGREYLLRQLYKVDIQYHEACHPWDIERLAEKPTKRWMREHLKLSDEKIDKIWEETEAPKPDWENHNIVCTTIARTMAYGKIQRDRFVSVVVHDVRGLGEHVEQRLRDEDRVVPEDVVIFFDDPAKEFFTWYKPYDPRFLEKLKEKLAKRVAAGEVAAVAAMESLTEDPDGITLDSEVPEQMRLDGATIKIEKINGRDYFVRPEHLVLGYALEGNRLVFTTTEELTRQLILYMYPNVYEPKLMPDQKMIAGDITMIKTNIVASKRDGFLLPIMNRLKKEGFEFNYIADGQGAIVNLMNNKGQNIFADKDSVIEISEPHFDVVTRFIDELHDHGWVESDRNALKVVLAMDALQQAIGRNSGYRWSDQEKHAQRRCIVLCEPKLQDMLVKVMRYYVGTVIGSVDDRVNARKDYISLVDGVCWFIRNLDSYLRNGLGKRGQAFWDDVQDVIQELPGLRRRTFHARLLAALNAKIKETKDAVLAEKLGQYMAQMGA
jgi:hypothetical protein